MAFLADAKQFIREMVHALDVSLDRLDGAAPERQLLLASQLIGSCDTLITLLVFLGESAPNTERFSMQGRKHLAVVRDHARRLRAAAYRELLEVEVAPEVAPPAADESADATPEAEAIPQQPE